MNELVFTLDTLLISLLGLIFLQIGKEALIAFICLLAVLVNLFVTQGIELVGLSATASDSLTIGMTLSLNLLQEYYDRRSALKAIWISFFCAASFTLMSILHLAYVPSPTDQNHVHFLALLSPMPRIIVASLSVFLFVQYLDRYLYSYLKERYEGRYYVLRNMGSTAIIQLLDTVLFSFMGLYKSGPHFDTLSSILQIIGVSYAIKIMALFLNAPFLSFTKRLVQK